MIIYIISTYHHYKIEIFHITLSDTVKLVVYFTSAAHLECRLDTFPGFHTRTSDHRLDSTDRGATVCYL